MSYEFKRGNEPMYNSTAICKYILDNDTNLYETAKHFEITESMVLTFVDYMERLDKGKYDKVISKVLRGHYTGGEYVKAVGVKGASEDIKKQNSHNVCDYMITNKSTVSEAERFFGIDRNALNKAIDRMAWYEYEKYVAVKEVQKLHGNNVKIMDNPNQAKRISGEFQIGDYVKIIKQPSPYFGTIAKVVGETSNPYVVKIEFDGKEYEAYVNSLELTESPVIESVEIKESAKDTEFEPVSSEELTEENVIEIKTPVVEKEVVPEPKMSFWQKVKYAFGFGG